MTPETLVSVGTTRYAFFYVPYQLCWQCMCACGHDVFTMMVGDDGGYEGEGGASRFRRGESG